MKLYDKDRSGRLSKRQVEALLTDAENGTPAGTPPTAEEIEFVMQSGDHGAEGPSLEELEYTVAQWLTYVQMRDTLDRDMKRFDISETGSLSKEELRNYLTELNDGTTVSDAEVSLVFEQADVLKNGKISRPELMLAISAWYTHLEESQSCCFFPC